MKKALFMLFAAVATLNMPVAASADLLIAWDTYTNPDNGSTQNAAFTASGFSGSFVTDTNAWGQTTTGGLAGSTFGTLDSSTATGTGEYDNAGGSHLSLNNAAVGFIDITVTNSTADDYVLDTFHFDHGATRPGAADAWTLSVESGALTAGTVNSGGAPNGGGATAAWGEFDESLSGLADNTLEAGQSVVFRLNLARDSTQGPAGHHAYLDNIAITGSVAAIPEPSSLAILGLAGLGLFVHRRK